MADPVAYCGSGRATQVIPSARLFAVAALAVVALAALVAGWFPLQCSIVTVFLFAGPHNWIEARYFLSRLPARWGKLRPFFLLAFAGVLGLTLSLAVLSLVTATIG